MGRNRTHAGRYLRSLLLLPLPTVVEREMLEVGVWRVWRGESLFGDRTLCCDQRSLNIRRVERENWSWEGLWGLRRL